MEPQKERQLSDILTEIKEMRRMMDAGSSAFRHIYQAQKMRLLFLVAGFFALFFPLAYQLLLSTYNYHNLIPRDLKVVYFILLGLAWLAMIVLRTNLTLKAGRELIKDLTIWGLLKVVMSHPVWRSILPVWVVLILLPIKLIEYWPGVYFVHYAAIIMGLIMNMMGVAIRSSEYSLAGFWFIVSSFIGLFWIMMPTHIAFLVDFAPGCFLFALIAYTRREKAA
jgi:hypothetical protein